MYEIKIILVGGKSGSGKDIFADYLVNNCNYKKLSFSEPLKDFVSKKYNINRFLLDTQDGKKKLYNIEVNGNIQKSGRELLIETALTIRDQNDSFFVDHLIKKIKMDNSLKFVISDFRYPLEYTKLVDEFSKDSIKCVKILRNKNNNINDSSEKMLDNFNFDFVINNNNTKKELYDTIDINIGHFF